jgi:GT2 family glycosyltransferase
MPRPPRFEDEDEHEDELGCGRLLALGCRTMNLPPKVSVVVTCYNLGRFLDEAVDSVFAQTLQDFEVVIVNDGSTDPDTVQRLAGCWRPRTQVVHIENRGLSGARNEGIRRTVGAYVCNLDADDRLEPTYFEKAVAVLDRDPSVAFVSHWLRTFGDEQWEWTPESPDFPALLDRNTVNGAALVRREALMAAGLFDESMRRGCEDWDLWITMVERGWRGVILPEVLFHYRRRADSMSRIMLEGDTHIDLYRYLIEKHRPSFEAHVIALLERREVEQTTVLREAHDLELDCDAVFGPETERLRDGLRRARGKLRRLEGQRSVSDELDRRTQALEHARNELAARQRLLAETEADLARQRLRTEEQEAELHRRAQAIADRDAEVERLARQRAELATELQRDREGIAGLHHEIGALRRSLSWRLTRPLRAVYSWLFERG